MDITAIVIDDDPSIRIVFSECLSMINVDVLATGKNGLEASQLYEKHRPDVVLMELAMPLYDGAYGLRKIRKSDPNARVIMVTALISSDLQKQLQENGAQAIILKPFEMEMIRQTIENVKNEVGRILVRNNEEKNLASKKRKELSA